MLWVIMFLMFLCFGLLGYTLVPLLFTTTGDLNKKQAQKFVRKMDRVLQHDELQYIYRLYLFAPLSCAVVGFLFLSGSMRIIGIMVGIILGLIFPRMYLKLVLQKRKVRFNDQLIDALMIMSSSFRGGLSLIQAIEAVTEEMPDPIRHEFSVVLGENKMGVSLDETLQRLEKRMPSPAVQQMITAILLSRETGGNLPAVFSRIVTSMRERKKIEQNLASLTIQGKLQAVVMTLLPVLFIVAVSASTPHFFDPMLNTPDGQKALILAGFLWVVGAFMIWKISSFSDF